MRLPRCFSRYGNWIGAGIFVALVLGAILLAIVVEDHEARAAWRAYQQTALNRGVKLDYRDFVKPPIADELNFFAAPLFAHLPPTDYEQARGIFPLPVIRKFDSIAPPYVSFDQQLEDWRADMLKDKWLDQTGSSKGRDILAALERKHGSSWEALLEAEARPQARLLLDLTGDVAAALLERAHLAVVDAAGWAHRLRAAAHLDLGHARESLVEARALIRLHQVLDREPVWAGQHLRLDLILRLVAVTREGLQSRLWSADEIQKLEQALEEIQVIPDFVDALHCERAIAVGIIDLAYAKRSEQLRIIGTVTELPSSLELFLPEYSFRWSQLELSQQTDAVIAQLAGATTPAPVEPQLGLRCFREDLDFIQHLHAPFARAFQPAMIQNTLRVRTPDAYLRMAVIACALERWRLTYGAYPASLATLGPEYVARANAPNSDFISYSLLEDGEFALLGSSRKDARIPERLSVAEFARLRDGRDRRSKWYYVR